MSSNNTSSIVSKVWAFCNTLRDDGVGYGDYLEQLTYLLFLKMADEYNKPRYNRTMPIPAVYSWETFTNKIGEELEVHCNNLKPTIDRGIKVKYFKEDVEGEGW
jgi:type I restriction enzyme M protein